MAVMNMGIMQKARARMLIKNAFFSTMLMTMPCHEDRSIPTLETDGAQLWYNPDFIDTLTVDQVMFALVHEVMHAVLDHAGRRAGRSPKKWNTAADYCINLVARDCGFTLIDGVLIDDQYVGLSADQVYRLLPDEQGSGGSGQGQSGGGKPGKGDGVFGQDLKDPQHQSEAAAQHARAKQMQRVAQAANVARMAGHLTGSLEKLIGELLNPVIPWNVYLRDYMTAVIRDDESWSRRNRRFADVFLPSRHSEAMGEIIFIPDTSGSMWGTDGDLDKICSEIAHCAESVRPERIRVIWVDVAIRGEQVFEAGEFSYAALKPVGGGGTDMRVALEYAARYDPIVAVLCTDGETPWPAQEPPYPLITVCTTQAPCPVGQVVRL